MGLKTPVAFDCWKENEVFKTKDIEVFYDGAGFFDVKALECPHCEENHWTTL